MSVNATTRMKIATPNKRCYIRDQSPDIIQRHHRVCALFPAMSKVEGFRAGLKGRGRMMGSQQESESKKDRSSSFGRVA